LMPFVIALLLKKNAPPSAIRYGEMPKYVP
jgi:hypothetical protein